jgi:hypothetical protein
MDIELDAGTREWLQEEIRALLERLPTLESRAPYMALASAIEVGHVPEVLLGALEKLLELSLQTGRIRHLYGPHVEATLLRLYHKTPAGAAIARATEEANQALANLQGHAIREIAFIPRGPGQYQLTIETDRCQIVLETNREGIWIKALEVQA